MPFLRKKKKLHQHRQSLFSDKVLHDYSVACCPCELYFPEPSLKTDEFGAIKEVCISGDIETLQWSKHCMVHVCEVPGIPAGYTLSLQDTGQESQICLSVILSNSKSGNFSYQIRERQWHEYSHKSGERWHRFVLQFDDENKNRFIQFEEKLKNILREVNLVEESKSDKIYLLLAIQTKLEKEKSSYSLKRHSRLSLANLQEITSDTEEYPACSEDSSSEENEKAVFEGSIAPPFDPAPFYLDEVKESRNQLHKDNKQSDISAAFEPRTVSIEKLCDSLNIHPDELPQTLQSILRSVQGYNSVENLYSDELPIGRRGPPIRNRYSAPATVPDIEYSGEWGLRSEFLPTEELYIPMGQFANERQKIKQKEESSKDTSMAEKMKSSPPVQKPQMLAQLLQTAISSGEVEKAVEYARQLAMMKVTVMIDVKGKQQSPAEKDREFNLKVNIEDKDSSGGSITLKVKASDTIRDLKNRMLLKHMFPVEVQYWIIGKRIRADTETLEKCQIKANGYTAFLYLVSAKSAGIDKDEFLRRQNLLLSPEFGAVGGLAEGFQTPGPDVSQTPSRHGSSATPGSGATTAGSSGKPKLEPKILDTNLNNKEEKKTHAKLQGQGQLKTLPDKKLVGPSIVRDDPVRQSGAEIAQILNKIALTANPDAVLRAEAGFQDTPYGESRRRVPVMHPEENEEPQMGWACPACTFINTPTRPGCEVCSSARPADYEVPAGYVVTPEEKKRLETEAMIERQAREVEERERQAALRVLQETDALDLIPNTEVFTCPICFDDISIGEGIILRECLHSFCKECLQHAIQYNEEAVLTCPYMDDDYTCDGILQDREVKGLVGEAGFARYLARSLATAESQAQNSFHCKTADCPGWCIYEDHVNFFVCQVCGKENCLTCKAIHQGMNCKQYQDDLRLRASNDEAASQTQIMIRKMLSDGDAMNCPQCHVIVMKKEGCDWIQCSICKTEICWVTKQRRWGPLGNGDISGGCMCRVNGEMCHPNCNNCH